MTAAAPRMIGVATAGTTWPSTPSTAWSLAWSAAGGQTTSPSCWSATSTSEPGAGLWT